MVETGVAEQLYEPEWMNRDGEIVEEQESFGCKILHRLIRLKMCIIGDKVGGSISMKGDGHRGGTLYLC